MIKSRVPRPMPKGLIKKLGAKVRGIKARVITRIRTIIDYGIDRGVDGET